MALKQYGQEMDTHWALREELEEKYREDTTLPRKGTLTLVPDYEERLRNYI